MTFKFTTASLGVFLLLYLFNVIYLSLTCSCVCVRACVCVCVCICPQRQDSSPLPHSSSFTFSTEMCHKSPELRVMGPALGNSPCSPSRLRSQNQTRYKPCIHPNALQYNIVNPERTYVHNCSVECVKKHQKYHNISALDLKSAFVALYTVCKKEELNTCLQQSSQAAHDCG